MNGHFVPRVGAVFSADIAVPDQERAVQFYARVLGTGAEPLWREDLMNNLGIPVIGVGAQGPEYSGLPIQWMPHIQVADVPASARRAVELGGKLLLDSGDADGAGQWAVLLDPNGAAFGLIPVPPAEALPPTDASADPREEAPVGRIAWLDLTVPGAPTTRDFYARVVGWQPEDVGMRDGEERYSDYNMLGADGTPAAGVCHARGANEGLPPVWMLYLPVGDLAESLRRVEAEGGEVVKTMKGGDGAIVYAAIRDVAGAFVALVGA